MVPTLQQLTNKYVKQFGEESVFVLAKGSPALTVTRQTTGISTLDAMLRGGLPLGRVIEVSGLPGTGKTSLMLALAKAAQDANPDKSVVYFEIEHSIDDNILATYNIDKNRFIFFIPGESGMSAEASMDALVEFASHPDICLAVYDSIAAVMTEEEEGKDIADGYRDKKPIVLGRTVKKLTQRSPKSCPVVFVNQLREAQASGPGQDKYYEPGGQTMRFHASLRMRLARFKSLENGFMVKAKAQKSRYSRPRAECTWYLDYDTGIDPLHAVIDLAKEQGIIKQAGAMYSFLEHKWKGMEALRAALTADPELLDTIESQLKFTTSEE